MSVTDIADGALLHASLRSLGLEGAAEVKRWACTVLAAGSGHPAALIDLAISESDYGEDGDVLLAAVLDELGEAWPKRPEALRRVTRWYATKALRGDAPIDDAAMQIMRIWDVEDAPPSVLGLFSTHGDRRVYRTRAEYREALHDCLEAFMSGEAAAGGPAASVSP